MKRIVTLLFVMALGWAAPAWSMTPEELVKQTTDKMLAKLKEEQAVIEQEPGRIYELVNEIVLPHFDFEYMSQLVLAKHWRRASKEQREAFVNEFRTLLVRTYATSLSKYTDQEVVFLPSRKKGGEEVTIKTEIDQAGGFPIPIDYRLHEKDSKWLVFDVVIDAVSLVTNYRSSFAKQIRKGGFDSLLETLAERNKQGTQSQ